jgi:hypothetical protein
MGVRICGSVAAVLMQICGSAVSCQWGQSLVILSVSRPVNGTHVAEVGL